MRERAERGECFCAEDYLGQPNGINPNAAVDVIYAEFVLRIQIGEQASAADFLQRFPRYRTQLDRQFRLDEKLASVDVCVDDTLTEINPASERVPLPRRIGKYVVISSAGRGGQADVYRAVHPDLDSEVVIKVAARKSSEYAKNQLLAEGQILVDLNHPGIARVYDLDFHEGRPYLVMDYIRGRTLDQYIKQEAPTAPQTCELVAKIADALAHAHRRGILHLDIKPSNILVGEDGEPRLIDFGLGLVNNAFVQQSMATGELRGTLPYMPPEQARGEGDLVDPRADIFSLGAVLYFCVVGEPPYESKDLTLLLQDVRANRWQREKLSESKAPSRLRRIIQKAMHDEPDSRYRSCSAMAAELSVIARGLIPFRKYILAATAICSIAAMLLLPMWLPSPIDPGPTPGLSVTPIMEASSMQVVVVDGEQRFELVHRAPLKTGDLLRVNCHVPMKRHISLFLVTSQGEIELLATYHHTNSERVSFPKEVGNAVPLTGEPGTEVIVMCGRESKPVSRDEFINMLGEGTELPMIPPATVLAADTESVFTLQHDRGFGDAQELPDATSIVSRRMDGWRQAIVADCTICEMIAFHHAAP